MKENKLYSYKKKPESQELRQLKITYEEEREKYGLKFTPRKEKIKSWTKEFLVSLIISGFLVIYIAPSNFSNYSFDFALLQLFAFFGGFTLVFWMIICIIETTVLKIKYNILIKMQERRDRIQ